MNAVSYTRKAKACRKDGRIFEAIYHYDLAIEKYQERMEEAEETEAQRIQDDILECRMLKEKLTNLAEGQFDGGKAVQNLVINDDATGYSYRNILGKFLNESVTEVLIEEPYLSKNFQCVNLINLLELMLKECELVFIQLLTKQYNRNLISGLKNALEKRDVFLFVKEDSSLHDRRIILNNGYKIKIGRGLHIYKKPEPFYSMGICDYDYRKCHQTSVEVIRRKHWLLEKVSSNFYFKFMERRHMPLVSIKEE